jgi:hypothetical protein
MVLNYYRPRWGLSANWQTERDYLGENVVWAGGVNEFDKKAPRRTHGKNASDCSILGLSIFCCTHDATDSRLNEP